MQKGNAVSHTDITEKAKMNTKNVEIEEDEEQ